MASLENRKALGKFYKPYLSDEEDDSSQSEYESDSSSGSSAPPPPKQRNTMGGSGAAPLAEVSGDQKPPDPGSMGSAFKFNQTKTAFIGGKNSTTIMINSSDRDTNIFPQPTHFTIRLPRTYRNVVALNVTQIKLLSSFYYFAAAKNNTSVRILEYNRTRTVGGVDISNAIDIYLRDGTYDSGSLVTELNNQLNRTPLYSLISRSDFISQFITTGNYSLLFNDPGDTTYNQITGIFEQLASKADIVARYFNTTGNLGVQYYSSAQTAVAYYYPMLKDMTIKRTPVTETPVVSPFAENCTQFVVNNTKTYASLDYKLTDSAVQGYLAGTNYYDKIVYSFQGLDDPYISLLCNDTGNQAIMDTYKADNTWNGYLVNKYTCSYDSTVGRLTVYSNQLNTSLVTTLSTQYQNILVKTLIGYGIQPADVPAMQTLAENYNGVISDMYNFLQKGFTNYFGVNYGIYAPIFYTNLSNELNLSDASGRYGWNLSYTGLPQANNSSVSYPDASGYWDRVTFNTSTGQFIDGDLYYPTIFGDLQRYTYTTPCNVDVSGFIIMEGATEESLGFQDISFNVMPTAYSKVLFRARCRQTIFIETIPPFMDEIPVAPKLAENYYLDPVNTPFLYGSASDSNILLDPQAADFFLYDISQNMLDGPMYMRTDTTSGQMYLKFVRDIKPIRNLTQIPPPGDIGIYTFRPHVFFQIRHAGYAVPRDMSHASTKFLSDIYIEREDSQLFGADFDFYWYRDRAAYMADVKNALTNDYWTNPKHYFIHQSISADISSALVTTYFNSDEISYGMILARGTLFPQQSFRIFVLRHNPYGQYTYPALSDYRRMPINTERIATKSTPLTNFPTPLPTLFNSSGFRNSYDLNGISNNLLDNFILTTDFSHYDPYSFTNNTAITRTPLRYVFQFKTPAIGPPGGVSAWSQYFFSASKNQIFDTSGGSVYYNNATAATEIANSVLPFKGISNEYVFVNWFRAGSNTNLYNPAYSPTLVPETLVAPFPVNGSPFTVFSPIKYSTSYPNQNLYGDTPFVLCRNTFATNSDISFNNMAGLLPPSGQIYLGPDTTAGGRNFTRIMGIPFTPPMGRYVTPTQVVLKFGYIQPTYNALNSTLYGRSSKLFLKTATAFKYQSYASSPVATSNLSSDLSIWDDKYYQNRQNLVLGIFRSKDIDGLPISSLDISNALCTLTLKKVCQVCQFSSTSEVNVNFSRTRSPEWGTYYIYETATIGSSIWMPYKQAYTGGADVTTQWAAVKTNADITNTIYTSNNSETSDSRSYFADVSNNSLCFVPFYPVLNPGLTGYGPVTSTKWAVGSFTGLTYTKRPYIPTKSNEALAENPYIMYNDGVAYNSVCVEEVGGPGLAMGDNSTYLGSTGPLCWGTTSDGFIMSPNYRKNKPFCPTFFNCRVNIKMADGRYNPMTDLTKFGGTEQALQCFSDTQMYVYDLVNKPGSDFNDISGSWGCEKATNFKRYDDDSGFNNLSYIPSIDISKNSTIAINVRGYVPTVKYLSGLRIAGKNWLDFGRISLYKLMTEIKDLSDANVYILPDGRINNEQWRIDNYYTHDYTRALIHFNNNYKGTFLMGKGITNPDYPGIKIVSAGFVDYMNQFIYYNTYIKDLVANITAAQASALAAVQQYIVTNYAGVLPPVVLQRNRYTEPLLFSVQFNSALVAPYTTAFDQWGLGWNLGFAKIDTGFNTRHVANTFIRIVDDYIYLKLNEDLNINNIDISTKEDLSQSRDTFGQSKRYYGKLLLNSFGSFAQTFIQSAKAFTIPVGRLDKLTFQLVDAYNRPLSNNDCEYNVVLQVDEMIDVIDTASIVVKGT